MQELICWLNTPQFHWIHQGHVATSPLVCNLLAGCWCWQGDTRGPKLLMRVIAQQRLGSPGPQLWLPASVSSCTRWKKLTWVICKLWIMDYMELFPHWSRQHSSVLSWLKLSVCEDQILFYFPTITEWINWKSLPPVWLWWSSLVSAQSVLRLISNSLIDIEMSSGKAKTVFLLELILKLF